MSAELLPDPPAAASRSRRTAEAFRRPMLALVPTPARARRAPFVALVLGVLLLGLLGLLLLTTASAQDAFRLHRLQTSAAAVSDQRQALFDQVNQLTGPAGLAARAQQLGMVPGGPPQFWKPGQPLPPGARVLDGIVIVPAANGAAPAKQPPTPSAPTDPAAAAVTSTPRPVGQQPTTASTGTAKQPAVQPSTRPSTSGSRSTKPSTSASGTAGTRSTTGSTTKPSTATSTGTKSTGTTSTTAKTTTQSTTAKTTTTRSGR
jgi:hypothetical protein